MKKNKDSYINYVCPYCWNTLDNCVCDIFPPYHLVFIDKNIQKHIQILNNKGYRTTGCCEGHMEVCISTYITFANSDFENIPEGFKYDKKRRMIHYNYSTRLTEKKMEEMKKEKLDALLKWCESLPNKNAEN